MDISKYQEIPYADKGRSFSGCDCWGLVYLFHKHEKGIILPTYTSEYMESTNKDEIHDVVVNNRSHYKEIPQGQEIFGDIINLRIDGKDWHVGIVLQNKRFLHIMKDMNCVNEKYNSIMWKNRIAGFYRYDI